MKSIIRYSTLIPLLASLSFAAMAAPASDASIETLLALTKSEAALNTMHAQIEPVMTQSIRQAFGAKSLTAEQQRAVDTAVKRSVEIMRSELSWTSMKPEVVTIYRETFSQDEVDGMIAYYRSPPSMAAVEKLPVVMQRSNAFVLARMPAP